MGMEKVTFDSAKFSARLIELRKTHKLSQMQLAEATGLSQSAIAKWETGKTEPTASALIALASFYDEKMEYILGLTD